MGGLFAKAHLRTKDLGKPSRLKVYILLVRRAMTFINTDIDIGDIVQFDPSGASVLVYERSSKSNALFLTQRCNSRCIMCPQPPQTHGDYVDLSIATAKLIKDEIATIGITGGEPTIAWNGLIQLLLVLNICHPNCRIELLTNGRNFHPYRKAKELSETNNHNIIACIASVFRYRQYS